MLSLVVGLIKITVCLEYQHLGGRSQSGLYSKFEASQGDTQSQSTGDFCDCVFIKKATSGFQLDARIRMRSYIRIRKSPTNTLEQPLKKAGRVPGHSSGEIISQ